MAGGRWSMDAPLWDSGSGSRSIGVFILAVDHRAVGRGFPARVESTSHAWPPPRTAARQLPHRAARSGRLALRAEVLADLRRRARRTTTASKLGKETRDRACPPRRRRPRRLGTADRLRDSGLDVKVLEVQPDSAAGPSASGSSDRSGRV
jgi:hypothetical protein